MHRSEIDVVLLNAFCAIACLASTTLTARVKIIVADYIAIRNPYSQLSQAG
jgi:hypothetical protein